jgi:putative endonuclease
MPNQPIRKTFYVYILASSSGTLYVGLTDDLRKRVLQHKSGAYEGFTKKYKIDRLIYSEEFHDAESAAAREVQVKKYRREKKVMLFAKSNPQWKDLSKDILDIR